jgi:A/G-specific adenine glycosylase
MVGLYPKRLPPERYARRVIDAAELDTSLAGWSDRPARDLVVRGASDPWHVLVVEVMSQQTQIERVGPKWQAFMAAWPTPATLADASTRHLLEAWAGLGYNRRALALRDAARHIVDHHGGSVPSTLDDLVALPGVGPYTARAVLAVAFGWPVAPLDVNVRRVVRRLVGDAVPPGDLQEAADALVSRRDPRRWTWAVMDLAATVCTRRMPACGACPVRAMCASAGTAGEVAATRPAVRFADTNRWLRGRILRGVRDAARGAWVEFDAPLGVHRPEAVERALVALEEEGFIERTGRRARLR